MAVNLESHPATFDELKAAVYAGNWKKAPTFGQVLRMVQHAAQNYGELPYSVVAATEGIAWALNTGRLPGDIDGAIRALKGQRAIKLVADVTANCGVMAEVPAYLISRFA